MTDLNPLPGELVLASASPRRRELLAVLGVKFRVAPADIDEQVRPQERPEDYVRRMALSKAQAGYDRATGNVAVLGSDTSVVVEGCILGKPTGRDDARAMLATLSGRSHRVLSAVALVDVDGYVERLSCTEVTFRPISEAEADAYWQTGEPADKAGGYAIQGLAACFVSEIRGSYSGVVGLPLYETAELLNLKGYGPILGIGQV
jgi:septum formation protein